MSSNDKETMLNFIKERNLAKALTSLKDSTYAHICQASKSTETPRSTLIDYLNGVRTHREANEHRQQLSLHEEHAFVQWVERLSCIGNPVYHSFLCELAQEIRKPCVENTDYIVKDLSKHWVSCFFACNLSLQSKVAKSIEAVQK